MSNFDPFFSTEYKKNAQYDMEPEILPQLEKKSESQYVSQFIFDKNYMFNKQIMENTELHVLSERQSQPSRIQESSHQTSSQKSKKSSTKNSPFHNFQKHLVITLRQILTMRCLSSKAGVQFDLAAKIFHIFKKSQKTSRQFLEQVFGLSEAIDSVQKSKQSSITQNSQLKQLFGNYQPETIFQAQKILKHLTKLQLEQCNLNQCLGHRKIQKKNEFIQYVNLFKTQLVSGKQRKKTYKLLAKKFRQSKIESESSSSIQI